MPPEANEPESAVVKVCDGCAASADCTAQAGGSCAPVGGEGCEPPAAHVCRYPKDVCEGCVYCTHDGKGVAVCRNAIPPMPASMPPSEGSPVLPHGGSPVSKPPQHAGPTPTKNNPSKAPTANAKGCKADAEHCCTDTGTIEWLNGCCGGALPDWCKGKMPGHAGDRGGDGMCVGCMRKCLPASALIATPRGDREIASLAIGDLVWTTNAAGARIAAPIEALRSLPIEGLHELVILTLDDGRRIRASGGHPTATAVRLDTLRPGDRIDGARVTDITREAYLGAATWDLRPAGGTTYWADGVLLGTTLTR